MGGVKERTKLVAKFDKNGDNRLDAQERKAAREYLKTQQSERPGGPWFGRRGPRRESQGPAGPGPKLTPSEVKSFGSISLYDENTLRTLFLEFENADWEKEVADFYHTDVQVPAKLSVDGKTYSDLGVSFRGGVELYDGAGGAEAFTNPHCKFCEIGPATGRVSHVAPAQFA